MGVARTRRLTAAENAAATLPAGTIVTTEAGQYLHDGATAGGTAIGGTASGSGDVTGPASCVSGSVPVFSGDTGKVLADGGTLLSDLATVAQLAAIADPAISAGIADSMEPSPDASRVAGYCAPTNGSGTDWGCLVAVPTGSAYTFNAVRVLASSVAATQLRAKVRLAAAADYATIHSASVVATATLIPAGVRSSDTVMLTFRFDSAVSVGATDAVWIEIWANGTWVSYKGSHPVYNVAPYPTPRIDNRTTFPDAIVATPDSYSNYRTCELVSLSTTANRLNGRGRLFAEAAGASPVVLAPAEYPMIGGRQSNLYTQNLIPCADGRVQFSVLYGGSYNQYDECVRIASPSADVTGDLVWRSPGNRVVAVKRIVLKHTTLGTGGATAIKWLQIGDSTTYKRPSAIAQMMSILSGSRIAFTPVGRVADTTNDFGGTSRSVKSEGLNGRSITTLIIDSGNYFGAPGHATDGSGFSLQYYLATHCSGETLSSSDWVVISLGSNSIAATTAYDYRPEMWDEVWVRDRILYDLLISRLRDATAGVPGIKIGIALGAPPQHSQDAFFGSSQWWMNKASGFWRYTANQIAYWDGRAAEGIYLLPNHIAFDPETGYPVASAAPRHAYTATTVARNNDGVHFSDTAAYQIGECYAATLLRHTAV